MHIETTAATVPRRIGAQTDTLYLTTARQTANHSTHDAVQP